MVLVLVVLGCSRELGFLRVGSAWAFGLYDFRFADFGDGW